MSHSSYEELQSLLAEARKKVETGGLYKHYSNPDKRYKVLHVALQEETQEPCVVYESLYSPGLIWVRNLDDWLAIVKDKDGNEVPRFTHVKE